jgi:hydrogenase-4 component E
MLTGFFIIATRKKLITHIMGYMILENGIFLLSLSAAKEMPFIVNLGVSMDIFIGVFLAGIFINRIKTNFDQHDIDDISRLKD